MDLESSLENCDSEFAPTIRSDRPQISIDVTSPKQMSGHQTLTRKALSRTMMQCGASRRRRMSSSSARGSPPQLMECPNPELAQENEGDAMSSVTTGFYDKGGVHIRYEEVGSGFSLFAVPGGGLNSRIIN